VMVLRSRAKRVVETARSYECCYGRFNKHSAASATATVAARTTTPRAAAGLHRPAPLGYRRFCPFVSLSDELSDNLAVHTWTFPDVHGRRNRY
jgi:hypothetical protein